MPVYLSIYLSVISPPSAPTRVLSGGVQVHIVTILRLPSGGGNQQSQVNCARQNLVQRLTFSGCLDVKG